MARGQPANEAVGLVAETRLMVNVVTGYQKVFLRLWSSRLEAEWPAPLLGVVPLRRVRRVVPLAELRSIGLVAISFPSRLVVSAVLAIAAIILDVPVGVTVLLGILALLFLLLGVVAAIEITDRTGRATIPVCWLQRSRARRFIDMVRGSVEAGAP